MIQTTDDIKEELADHVARFRKEGPDSKPVVFGDNHQPEAVLLAYPTFRTLLELAEDIAIVERLRQRSNTDSGKRTTLTDAANIFGIDLGTI